MTSDMVKDHLYGWRKPAATSIWGNSIVRAFAHGAMGRRIDPSCGGSIELVLIPASAPQLV